MTDQEVRKGGGGKLSRDQTVTVRLDLKLRYLAELAARKQRRTLSSYIEWAIEDSLKSVLLYTHSGHPGDPDVTVSVADEAARLWDVDDAERFVRLAIHYPDLLSHQEQEVWKLVQDSHLLLPAQQRRSGRVQWDRAVLEDDVFPVIRRRWPALIAAYATGSPSARSEWVERTRADVDGGKVFPGFPRQLPDDDIPF